jgi:hypothetical protein
MKISDDRRKILNPAGKRDISKILNSTGRYFFPCLGAARIAIKGGKDGATGVFVSLRAYAGFCRLSQLPIYVSRTALFNLQ